ncbi:MAG TPA: hypothetical protein VLU46_06200 [Thermoanaerobaculia bacterium]|nr:hypothetical protein [Thermoanaerobaculia bacterium]
MLKPVDFELSGQYVLATYRKALGVPPEAASVNNSQRVRSFCGRCGAEWVGTGLSSAMFGKPHARQGVSA